MAAGSIPVIITSSSLSLPFSKLIDWIEISVQFRASSASSIVPTLQALSPAHIQTMQTALHAAYTSHFSSPALAMLSTLAVLDQTVFSGSQHSPPPPANPVLPPPNKGFTAVILTFNRVESLFLPLLLRIGLESANL